MGEGTLREAAQSCLADWPCALPLGIPGLLSLPGVPRSCLRGKLATHVALLGDSQGEMWGEY